MSRNNRSARGFSLIPKTEKGRQAMLFFIAVLTIFSFAYAISIAVSSYNAAHNFIAKYQMIDQTKYRNGHK